MRFTSTPSDDHNQPCMTPPRTLPSALLLLALAALSLPGLSLPALAADRKAPPINPAPQYPLFETHEKEHVSVAADPCAKVDDCKFFRNPYLSHGFLPIRVIITNDGDQPLDLNDVRIQFISADKDIIPAALPEDLNRRLYSKKAAQGRSMPLPFPGAHIPISAGEQVDKKITDDDRDFGFPSTTVAPHTTQAGYLFYDVKDLDDPVLKHATLFLKEMKIQGTKSYLFDFNLPFDKWLAAQPAPPKKEAAPVK
jgi:hypothetical protein